jgi:hypothetical protein
MSRDPEAKVDPRLLARLYDKRTVERNIKKGLVSRKDYEKYLKSLDDAANKGVYGGPLEEPDEPDYGDEDDVEDEEEVEEKEASADEGSDEGPETNNTHS